jgi:hypothetical protein
VISATSSRHLRADIEARVRGFDPLAEQGGEVTRIEHPDEAGGRLESRTKWVAVVLVVLMGAAGVIGAADWRSIAISMAPKKRATPSRSAEAIAGDSLFWETLHGGAYHQLARAIAALTRAYVAAPADAATASHVGWLHIWRVAEAGRLDSAPASITDDIVLSRKYFQEAVALDPADARKLGFLGGSMVAEGTVDRNEKLIRRGYYTMRDAIDAWPEFNLFTAGFVLSRTPRGSPQFREALDPAPTRRAP